VTPSERRERLLEWLSDPTFLATAGVTVSYVYHCSGGPTGLGPEYRDMAEARYDLNTLERAGKLRRIHLSRPARWEVVR